MFRKGEERQNKVHYHCLFLSHGKERASVERRRRRNGQKRYKAWMRETVQNNDYGLPEKAQPHNPLRHMLETTRKKSRNCAWNVNGIKDG